MQQRLQKHYYSHINMFICDKQADKKGPGGLLHAFRYLQNIRYGISLFVFVIRYSYAVLRYSYSVFVIHMRFRYSYAFF